MLVHPLGNPNVRGALHGLYQAGLLTRFVTALAIDPDNSLLRLLPGGLRQELMRRAYPEIPSRLIEFHPWREIARLVATRSGLQSLVRHETGVASFDAVYHAVGRAAAASLRHAKPIPRIVYAYDGGALETFQAAAERGIRKVYELPTAGWWTMRQIQEEEELQPAGPHRTEGWWIAGPSSSARMPSSRRPRRSSSRPASRARR